MTWKEILKIFFIALIAGNIMGIVLIQIFETLTITSLIILEISLVITIVLLFIASKMKQNSDVGSNVFEYFLVLFWIVFSFAVCFFG